MGLNDTFDRYAYDSDDGKTYQVKLSLGLAGLGQFAIASGNLPVYPHHNKNMRHIWVKDAAGQRTKVYMASVTSGVWKDGGTFIFPDGRSYDSEGFKGERRDLRNT